MYNVRDFLQFVRPLVNQYGATHAIGTKSFLFSVNHALNMLYNYQGYPWTWQHTKDDFTNLSGDPLKLITSYPILFVDKFYTGKMQPIDWAATACDCPEPEPDPCGPYIMPCVCACDWCEELKWMKVLPQNKLCGGQYQVSSSLIPGMGWLNGRLIKVKPDRTISGLWVTYFRGVRHVKTFDDIIDIPDNFMTALSYFVAAQVIGNYAQFRNGDDVNYLTLARQELDSLKKHDNIFPSKMEFDKHFPFYGNQQTFNTYPS